MTSKDDQKVLMAKIGAAHGIRGEVRVKPYGDDPLSFADYGILTTRDGKRSFEVERARVQKTVVITKFKGIADRNQAEELNGVDLFIDRDQLPEPRGAGLARESTDVAQICYGLGVDLAQIRCELAAVCQTR